MSKVTFEIRDAKTDEFELIGQLMVSVYAQLHGFPSPKEQPKYYEKLSHVGALTEQKETRLLVAVSDKGIIGGAVVYFGDMKDYGSGGIATQEQDAAGFRLLAVDLEYRGQGLGQLLTQTCIDRAKAAKKTRLVIHSTKAMQIAWAMYEKMGFERAPDLDFMQGNLPVFGFRLQLGN
ncbi:MAG: GNAT family N-acetyltransferase [Reichenbachiella sp.]|uniref:GNAT family N-acetyltransferase n=1 Tax=Reichenbachiella sp. TaxID=2184521 RepID=UPI0032969159